MLTKINKNADRQGRHTRIRKHLSGTAQCPRLNVYRSLTHIYAQVIDDVTGTTLCAASDMEAALRDKAAGKSKKEAAKMVGELVAKRAMEKNIKTVAFDRGGYLYTGRVAELAAAAREAGLEF